MKAKMLILILLSSLILGCRSKTKATFYSKEGKTEIERIKIDSTSTQTEKSKETSNSENTVKSKEQEFSGDIIIKGKSDSLNPLLYHNVVNGDTLQSILIKGNADFIINNHYKKAEQEKVETKKEEKLNDLQIFARKTVSKGTIKEVASKIESASTKIKSNGLQFGGWITAIILGVVAVIIIGLIIYFKRKK